MRKQTRDYAEDYVFEPYQNPWTLENDRGYFQCTLIRAYRSGLSAHYRIRTQASEASQLNENEKQLLKDGIRQTVRYCRSEQNNLHITTRNRKRTMGGVYVEPGAFLDKEIAKEIKRTKAKQNKRPYTKVHHIGIEFECMSKMGEGTLVEKVIEADLHNYLSVGFDGSVKVLDRSRHESDCSSHEKGRCDCGKKIAENYYRGVHEIRALIPQPELKEALTRICKFFDDQEICVNESCGMHVHLDVRNRDAQKVVRNLYLSQKILFSLVPKSRRSNDYCRPAYKILNPEHDDRYSAINSKAISKYKTVEVRLHHGCLNFKKIYEWVRLLIAVAEHEELTEPLNTLEAFRQINISPDQRLYLLKRMRKFGIDKRTFPHTMKAWKEKHPKITTPKTITVEGAAPPPPLSRIQQHIQSIRRSLYFR